MYLIEPSSKAVLQIGQLSILLIQRSKKMQSFV